MYWGHRRLGRGGKYAFPYYEEAIDDIRQGKMVVLVDDEDRENEGDLTMAADKVTRRRSIHDQVWSWADLSVADLRTPG